MGSARPSFRVVCPSTVSVSSRLFVLLFGVLSSMVQFVLLKCLARNDLNDPFIFEDGALKPLEAPALWAGLPSWWGSC